MERFDRRMSDAAVAAVLQTTQTDHERRITKLEGDYGKLLMWTMGATTSSMATLAAVVIDIALRFGGHP